MSEHSTKSARTEVQAPVQPEPHLQPRPSKVSSSVTNLVRKSGCDGINAIAIAAQWSSGSPLALVTHARHVVGCALAALVLAKTVSALARHYPSVKAHRLGIKLFVVMMLFGVTSVIWPSPLPWVSSMLFMRIATMLWMIHEERGDIPEVGALLRQQARNRFLHAAP